eukprot:980663-Rhodomonas_salina.1
MAPSGNGRFLLGKKKDTDKFYIRRDPRGYIIGECPRDHPRVVQRLRDLAETWGANTEVTVIVTASDPEKPDLAELDKIARYLAGYACKNSDRCAQQPAPGMHTQSPPQPPLYTSRTC